MKINDKEYKVDSSAYTAILYKSKFGTGIFQDLKKVQEVGLKQQEAINKLKKENPKLTEEEINEKSSLAIIDSLDDFIYIIEKMAYILIVSADSSQVGSFEDFLKGIPKVKLDDQWIVEVTNKMVSSFC